MPGDDLFTRYLEIGASIVGMTRERAEAIVRDLVASGEMAKSQATRAADRLVDRGKTASEELSELVRREIRQQVSALGLATKADVARLEAQIEELRAAPAPQARTATKRAPARKRAGAAPPAGGAEPPKG
jgi:polyhydroxyalkanoate synthesis regulator phasin